MSYPAFNLTTLQLPAPSSNMTKAEYKTAYGIDLDSVDIRSFKLIIFGKDKFPINQIKAVDDGYEIYFNGRILSITDIVQTSDEVYDVANSKPIYYHPLRIESTTEKFKISGNILNNNGEPFVDLSALIAYIRSKISDSITYFDFIINGGIVIDGVVTTVYLVRVDATTARLYYLKSDGSGDSIDFENATISLFSDSVNKIN